jgi:hypothetical protein
MLVIEIEDCREKGGWRAVDSRNAARGSELEAGDDDVGGARRMRFQQVCRT